MKTALRKQQLAKCNNKKSKIYWGTQLGYYAMIAAPALIMIIWQYIPMFGAYIAFTDYKPKQGIWGSEFVGFENFKKFFTSPDFERVFRNTVGYSIIRIILVNLVFGILFALLLYEIRSKLANKIYHTSMLLPAFLSWSVVAAASLVLLNPDNGVVNRFLVEIGLKPISWYRESKYWPYIIAIFEVFKGAGMGSIYYYSALLSIDMELFDAASLDGAGRLRQIWYISLPAIKPVMCITLITAMGSILSGSLSPFYELTFDSAPLYETTLTLGMYLKNGLGGGRYAFSAAVGLVQSVIGLVLVLTTNTIIKKIDPDSAMF